MTDWVVVLGLTLDLIGVLMIAYAALSVHHRFRHEHRVDDAVFSAMRQEHYLGIAGVTLIALGYICQVVYLFIV